MTTQIAVRLPDELVDFLDEAVRSGSAPSRAAIVARALQRELRRESALRDAAILAATGGYPDLDSLSHHLSIAPLDID